MTDATLAVVAIMCHGKGGRATATTVKLAKGDDRAKAELKRMIGVVVGSLKGKHTVENGDRWAHVQWEDGLYYHFSIEKASWVRPA